MPVIIIVNSPNTNAVASMPNTLNPKSIASAAPKLEPLATPKVSGVASGFEKNDWNIRPASGSDAPTNIADMILGMRTFARVNECIFTISLPLKKSIMSYSGIFNLPKPRQNIMIGITIKNKDIKILIFMPFFFSI